MLDPLIVSLLLHWCAAFIYSAATIANVTGVIFKKKKVESVSYKIIMTGLFLHSLGLFLRWYISGHGPYIIRHEILSSDAWVCLVVFFIFIRFFPASRPVSLVLFPVSLLILGLSLFQDPTLSTLPPSLKSGWLVLHVLFYKISVGTFLTAITFSVFYILKKHKSYQWLSRVPEPSIADMYAYRFTGFAFIFWSLATLAGSIWANDSWGRFWGWDPIETWSFITWLLLGLYLHLRRFFNLSGEKAAFLLVVCFTCSIIALFFVPIFDPALHAEYFQ